MESNPDTGSGAEVTLLLARARAGGRASRRVLRCADGE